MGRRVSAGRRRAQDAAKPGAGRAESSGLVQSDRHRLQRRPEASLQPLWLLLLHARGRPRRQLVAANDAGPQVTRPLRRVVALGGGTGLPAVLAGLRRHLPRACRITAVVTAADDGGSSGILRRQYDVLPMGDIRHCLIALAQVAPEVTAALECRLSVSAGPEHALGNLLLTALSMVAADEIAAIQLAASLLGIRDVILPSTTTRVTLVADLADGRRVHGEAAIPQSRATVLHLGIDPMDASPATGVVAALGAADVISLGPGSFYTSGLATLIVPGIVEAILGSEAMKI